jgi:hypothetical protein
VPGGRSERIAAHVHHASPTIKFRGCTGPPTDILGDAKAERGHRCGVLDRIDRRKFDHAVPLCFSAALLNQGWITLDIVHPVKLLDFLHHEVSPIRRHDHAVFQPEVLEAFVNVGRWITEHVGQASDCVAGDFHVIAAPMCLTFHYVSFMLRSTPDMCISASETTENHPMSTASLTLTGSVAALAAALQAFDAASADAGNSPRVQTPPTPSTDTGLGTVAPMPLPSAPSGAALTPIAPMPSTLPDSTDSDDDEDGEASDGSGLDAEGLPWDERIHSSSKKKTAKGVWAAVRNGPKGEALAAIKDELRGVTQAEMPLPTPTPVMAPLPVPMPVAAAPVMAPLPVPMPVPMPVAAAPAATEEWDFAKLMAHIGPKMGMGGVIDPTYLAAVCQHYGIGSITDSATKPEVISQLVAQFQADSRW